MSGDELFRYAVCKPVAKRLDRATFYKYLDGSKLNVYGKAVARETFASATYLAARYEELAQKEIAKDAVFGPIFDAGEKGFAEWEKAYAANTAAFDAAWAYRAAFYGNSKKARLGCFEGLRTKLAAAIAAKKPKTLEAAIAAQSDSLGYALTTALMLCAAADGQTPFSNMLNRTAPFKRYPTGPRAAAYYAVVDAINDVLADRDRFSMKPGYFAGEAFISVNNDASYVRESGAFGQPAQSIVLKTEKKGDNVKVTFKSTSYVTDDVSCTNTNRIERITDSGQVIYRQSCVVRGKITVKETVDPVMVPKWSAGGITKGGLAKFYCSDKKADNVRLCFTTEAYKDKDAKKISNYLGAELK